MVAPSRREQVVYLQELSEVLPEGEAGCRQGLTRKESDGLKEGATGPKSLVRLEFSFLKYDFSR